MDPKFSAELTSMYERAQSDPAAAHRRGRIELLSDGHERDVPGIKGFDDFGKVGQATCDQG